MFAVVEAAGHPRDMGQAQGRALAAAVVDAVVAAGGRVRRRRWPSLAAYTAGPVRAGGVARETIRHYTHLAERMDGLARGANVPVDAIHALHAGTAALAPGAGDAGAVVALSALGLEDSPGVTIARSLPALPSSAEGGLVVRRSRPAVGFESIEVAPVWCASAWAGVNDAGLTACVVPLPAAEGAGAATAPSPMLLVQESLQRFGSVATAVDWATSRPACGAATLLLADADGVRAAVHFAGDTRRAEWLGDEPVAIGRPARVADALGEAAAGDRVLDEKALCPPDEPTAPRAFVRLIPTRRSLEVSRPGAPRESLRIEV